MRRLRSAVLTMSITAVAAPGTVAAVATADDDPASRKAEDVVAAAQRDMATVKSVHVVASESEKAGVTKISGTFTAAGPADFSVAEGQAKAHLVVLAKAAYIKGNLTYWKSVVSKKEGTSVARKLAGKWIKQPASKGQDATTGISDLTPKHIASCLGSHPGTLSNKGVKTAGGQKVIVIQDAGDKPGSAPSQLWVAAEGAALPVRMVQTGPRKSGGTKDAACDGDSDSKTTKSDIAFSQYNKTKPVTAPHGAVSPQQAMGGGSDDDGGGTTDL